MSNSPRFEYFGPLSNKIVQLELWCSDSGAILQKTVRFMENAVKRMKEVKYAMKIVIRRLDAI